MKKHRYKCADGAYPSREQVDYLQRATEDTLNYLNLSHARIGGVTYGSDEIYTVQANLIELHGLIAERYMRLSGETMPFGQPAIALAYGDYRKGNSATLRDGKPIHKSFRQMSLLGEEGIPIGATLYVYWGRNQIKHRRLVKVGYTTDDLSSYLKSLARQYDPLLMASRPGDSEDETAFHANWRRFVAEGREWYWAADLMFGLFRREWKLAVEFEKLVTCALTTSLYGSE